METNKQKCRRAAANGRCHVLTAVAGALIAQFALLPQAWAMELDAGNPDVKARWDNTVKYSTAWRLKDPSDTLVNSPPASINLDDGDRNFGKGLISNRLDLLSEFDASYKSFGVRVSGAAWYDDVYNKSTDNNSPFTSNSFSVANDRFTEATRNLHAGGPFAGPPAFFRWGDKKAKSSGQGGIQLRWTSEAVDTDFGFYAIRFHEKTPQVYVRPSAGVPNFATGQVGTYNMAYH